MDVTHGELVLDVEQGTIFTVAQYCGQPGLGYFCLEAEKATLYHRGVGATAVDMWGQEVLGGLWAVTGMVSSLSQAHKIPSQRALRTTCCPLAWNCPALLPHLSWLQPSTHQKKG